MKAAEWRMVPSATSRHAGDDVPDRGALIPSGICPENENPATMGGVFEKYGNEEGDLEAQRKN